MTEVSQRSIASLATDEVLEMRRLLFALPLALFLLGACQASPVGPDQDRRAVPAEGECDPIIRPC